MGERPGCSDREWGDLYVVSSNGTDLVCLNNLVTNGRTIRRYKHASWKSKDSILAEAQFDDQVVLFESTSVTINLTQNNRPR